MQRPETAKISGNQRSLTDTVNFWAGNAPDFVTEIRSLHVFPAAGANTVAPTTRHPPDSARHVILPFELVVAILTSDALVPRLIALATWRTPPTSTVDDVATSDESASVVASIVYDTFVAFFNFDTLHFNAVVVQTAAPVASRTTYPVK